MNIHSLPIAEMSPTKEKIFKVEKILEKKITKVDKTRHEKLI
jgi:hypothetical protein